MCIWRNTSNNSTPNGKATSSPCAPREESRAFSEHDLTSGFPDHKGILASGLCLAQREGRFGLLRFIVALAFSRRATDCKQTTTDSISQSQDRRIDHAKSQSDDESPHSKVASITSRQARQTKYVSPASGPHLDGARWLLLPPQLPHVGFHVVPGDHPQCPVVDEGARRVTRFPGRVRHLVPMRAVR